MVTLHSPAPSADAPPTTADASPFTSRYVLYALIVLFLVNLLNYVDRNILASLLPLIQHEYGVSDKWIGFLGSSFIWVYMVAAIPFGYLADRLARNCIVALGVGLWSLATGASAWVPSFATLFVCRAFVGVGEAAYAAASPTMIADYFRPALRNRALSFFFIAIPVGAGLGFVLGGILGQAFGWRTAFVLAAAPGVVFTVVVSLLREPLRGRFDVSKDVDKLPLRESVRRILRIRSYVWVVAGQILLTFSLGGVAVWLPTYFVRAHGMTLSQAGTFCGGALVIGSLAGTVFGGLLADFWGKYSRNALIHTISSGLAISAVILPVFLFIENRYLLFGLLLIINFFMFWYTGPINTVITNVSPPNVRAMAISVQILLIHVLGDAFSPGLMGIASDVLQARGLNEAEALRYVLLIMLPIPVFVAAVVTEVGRFWAPDDMERVVGAHPLNR